MNKNQRVAFWAIYIAFCIVATLTIFLQEALTHLTIVGGLILTFSFIVVAFLIHRFVKSNPKEIEKWFK